ATAAGFFADGVFVVALALATLEVTRSPGLVAGVSFAARLPWLLLALHAGVLADRCDRRRILMAASFLRAFAIATLAVLCLHGAKHVVILYAVAFALGVAETLFDNTVHSVVPRLVPADRLESANSRMQAAEVVMQQFLGPSIGGLLAALGVAVAFM